MYSVLSFVVFVFLGPFIGSALSSGDLNPSLMMLGLVMGVTFFPITLVTGLPVAVVAWLSGMGLSQGLRVALIRFQPESIQVSADQPLTARFKSKRMQVLTGTLLGAVSGFIAWLVTSHFSFYVSHGTQAMDFRYIDTLTGLICGMISAAMLLPREETSSAVPPNPTSPT
jgi:hypothetical protein